MAGGILSTRFPQPSGPVIDDNGMMTREWLYFFQSLFARTGDALGISVGAVQTAAAAAQATANTGVANAAAAQATANTGVANAATAQTTANSASAATAAETSRAEAAEALLAPKASPSFTGAIAVGVLASTVGFYGTTPIAKQTGVPITIAAVHAALTALGLIAP